MYFPPNTHTGQTLKSCGWGRAGLLALWQLLFYANDFIMWDLRWEYLWSGRVHYHVGWKGVLPGEEVYLISNNASDQSFPAGICVVVSSLSTQLMLRSNVSSRGQATQIENHIWYKKEQKNRHPGQKSWRWHDSAEWAAKVSIREQSKTRWNCSQHQFQKNIVWIGNWLEIIPLLDCLSKCFSSNWREEMMSKCNTFLHW